jgi:hypothetical protein
MLASIAYLQAIHRSHVSFSINAIMSLYKFRRLKW